MTDRTKQVVLRALEEAQAGIMLVSARLELDPPTEIRLALQDLHTLTLNIHELIRVGGDL